eukprot:10252405-Alexandrium_andersonii.AAC.1
MPAISCWLGTQAERCASAFALGHRCNACCRLGGQQVRDERHAEGHRVRQRGAEGRVRDAEGG